MLKTIATAALMVPALLCSGEPVSAECVCRCVMGTMQPLCSSVLDVQPYCPHTVCPITPQLVAPVPLNTIPPIGARSCTPRQVLSPYSGQYEWQTVCR